MIIVLAPTLKQSNVQTSFKFSPPNVLTYMIKLLMKYNISPFCNEFHE